MICFGVGFGVFLLFCFLFLGKCSPDWAQACSNPPISRIALPQLDIISLIVLFMNNKSKVARSVGVLVKTLVSTSTFGLLQLLHQSLSLTSSPKGTIENILDSDPRDLIGDFSKVIARSII